MHIYPCQMYPHKQNPELQSPTTPKQFPIYQVLWGHHDICPTLEQFHAASISQSELSSLTSLKAWGDLKKFRSDVAFLLILTEEGTAGDRVYSLSLMWVHPYQARVCTMEEAVKQLTPTDLYWA